MIEKFIEENIEKDLKAFVSLTGLYSRYTWFCEVNNIEPLIRTRFNNALDSMNIGVRHRKMVNYQSLTGRQGVRLSPCKY